MNSCILTMFHEYVLLVRRISIGGDLRRFLEHIGTKAGSEVIGHGHELSPEAAELK